MASRQAVDGNGSESVLKLYDFIHEFAPKAFVGEPKDGLLMEKCIFFGEEACDLSRSAAEWHLWRSGVRRSPIESAAAYEQEHPCSPAWRRRGEGEEAEGVCATEGFRAAGGSTAN